MKTEKKKYGLNRIHLKGRGFTFTGLTTEQESVCMDRSGVSS